MEALLEREEQVESWNDERLDELSRRMDAGFERAATKEEMNQRFDEVSVRFGRLETSLENQFGRIDERLDRLMLGMVFVAASFVITMMANWFFG
jgi:hypothetical protein